MEPGRYTGRNTRHTDPADSAARSGPWACHRPNHRALLARRTRGRAGIAVSGALQARRAGSAQLIPGNVGEQSPRQILPHNAPRSDTAAAAAAAVVGVDEKATAIGFDAEGAEGTGGKPKCRERMLAWLSAAFGLLAGHRGSRGLSGSHRDRGDGRAIPQSRPSQLILHAPARVESPSSSGFSLSRRHPAPMR